LPVLAFSSASADDEMHSVIVLRHNRGKQLMLEEGDIQMQSRYIVRHGT
jgi:hypothetical protein